MKINQISIIVSVMNEEYRSFSGNIEIPIHAHHGSRLELMQAAVPALLEQALHEFDVAHKEEETKALFAETEKSVV